MASLIIYFCYLLEWNSWPVIFQHLSYRSSLNLHVLVVMNPYFNFRRLIARYLHSKLSQSSELNDFNSPLSSPTNLAACRTLLVNIFSLCHCTFATSIQFFTSANPAPFFSRWPHLWYFETKSKHMAQFWWRNVSYGACDGCLVASAFSSSCYPFLFHRFWHWDLNVEILMHRTPTLPIYVRTKDVADGWWIQLALDI